MQELHRLRQFVAVAEELHVGRAAVRLGISQPPLSMQIRRMEEDIGVALFHRENRRLRLTEAGAVLLEQARQTLAQADRAIDLTRRAGLGEAGHLRIGFISTAGYSFLPTLLRRFQENFPEIALSLREMTTDAQLRAFARSELDAGFVLEPVSAKDIATLHVHSEDLVAALPAGSPLSRQGKPLCLADLSQEGFVLPPPEMAPGLHEAVLTSARTSGFTPRIAQTAVQMQTIVNLVSAGIGVAIVPACMKRAQRADVAFRLLDDTLPDFGTALAWNEKAPSPALSNFVAFATRHQRGSAANHRA